MELVCSYCAKKLAKTNTKNDLRTEFTMCVACQEYFDEQLKGMTIADFLDSCPVSVVVVNANRRMVSCNKEAERMLGKPRGRLTGLMAGEFLECENAIVSGGCGKSVRCASCVIRNTVTDTMVNGTDHENIPAYLNIEKDRVLELKHLSISTKKVDELIFLSVAMA